MQHTKQPRGRAAQGRLGMLLVLLAWPGVACQRATCYRRIRYRGEADNMLASALGEIQASASGSASSKTGSQIDHYVRRNR
jgi:hypothetical protein